MAELLRAPTPADAAPCHAIEVASYEGDEAATLAKIATRIATYPDGFLILEEDGEIAGFLNSGCAHHVELADEAFKELIGHDPEAPHAVILSLVVAPAFQGRGYARRLMEAFAERMQGMDKLTIHLMCRDHHVGFYEKLGFRYLRPSQSGHGGLVWHEMVREI